MDIADEEITKNNENIRLDNNGEKRVSNVIFKLALI